MNNEVNVWLDNISQFLKMELSVLEAELKKRLLSVTANKVDLHNVFNYFFNTRGKRLRPILVLLSSGLVRSEKSNEKGKSSRVNDNEIKLAASLELIHSSSLIHDDIVDESSHRRGQTTMNHKFNNKIAVLAGDLLYSHAFLFMNKLHSPLISGILSGCVEKMCQSEINEIISPYTDFKKYIEYLDAKTASLMSACCKCGAIIAGADESTVASLGEFGRNFGISYQLTDDFLDDEQPKNFNANLLLQSKIYAERARKSIKNFKDSVYKEQLLNLIRYIVEKPELKQAGSQQNIS